MSKFREHIGSYAFKYDRQKLIAALKESLAQGMPIEALYMQVLAIGQIEIARLTRDNPVYLSYIDDLISDLDERCVDIVQRFMLKPKTREYPAAYARRAIRSRFLDVIVNMQSVRETRQKKVRQLAANKPTLWQIPLKADTKSYTPDTLEETWEELRKLAKNAFELQVMYLRSQGYFEVEIGQQLGVHRLTVLRTLKSLRLRYNEYLKEQTE